MGLDAHCAHTCTIQRASRVLDALGEDVETWVSHLVGVRCRLVIKTQRVPDGVLAERPIVTTYLLLVPGATRLAQGDRVINIADPEGLIDAGPFRIDQVLPRRGSAAVQHTSYSLERVGGRHT